MKYTFLMILLAVCSASAAEGIPGDLYPDSKRNEQALPLAQEDGYFIHYIKGTILYTDRKTGEMKTLLWSGTYQENNAAGFKHTVHCLDAAADRERVYALSLYSRPGVNLCQLSVFWRADGTLLNRYNLEAHSKGRPDPPQNTFIIKSRLPYYLKLNIGNDAVEVDGAKISFKGKEVIAVEHARAEK